MPEAKNYPNAPYLIVADPARSIRFYARLGFELSGRWPERGKPMHASLVLDRQVVMVGSLPTEEQCKRSGMAKDEVRRIKKDRKAFKKHRHGVGVELYLHVDDPDAHHRLALRRKIEVLREPATHFYGIRDYIAVDPDGYRLVFFTRAPSDELTPAPRRKTRRKASKKNDRVPDEVPTPATADSAPQ